MSAKVAAWGRPRSAAARRARRAGVSSASTARVPAATASLEPLESRVLMSSVAGRYVFYNHSAFDENDPAANAADEGAVAVNKTALLPGETAGFEHYTSYARGINGIAVEIAGDPGTLGPDSFVFRAGNTDDPESWAAAPAPAEVVRIAPPEGSDVGRYLITWPDGAIVNQWLQVTVKADAGTGLSAPDVFYFGNLVGETGDRPASAAVNALDVLKVRRRMGGRGAGVADVHDFNRDGRVNALDLVIARHRSSKVPLRLFTAPQADPVAPEVSITAPAGGAALVGTVTITATATDNVGVAGVQFFLDGVPFGPEDTAAPYSIEWDTTAVPDGVHRLMAIARDEAGQIGFAPAVEVTVSNSDAAAPAVSVVGPAGGATVGGMVTLSADASDNVAVAAVQFFVDGAAVGAEDTSAPYSIQWDSHAAADGAHTITARARDAAGNSTTSATVAVTVSNSPTARSAVGEWSPVINWPLVAINQVLLRDGRVLMWDGDGGGECIGSSSARVYDPITGQFTAVPIPWFTETEDDIFCSGQTLLADGRVFVVGGHDCNGPGTGIKMTALFDPATLTWTRGPDMRYARWYPTATTLSDGRVLILGGAEMANSDFVPIPEIYDPVANTLTTLDSASLTVPSYSFVFQHPDGRVFVTGSDEFKMRTYALDLSTQQWSVVDPRVLDAGSGVMYLPGKFMKAGSSYLADPEDNGGAVPSLATTWVMDATGEAPAWQQTAPMAHARSHLGLTILPDGNVLAVGGSSDIGGLTPSRAVLPAELWSPATQTWTTLASMQTPRMYHSTALLLPDGRVLVAGGGRLFTATNYLNAEIYSPGYLFRGPRPTITSTQTTLAYGVDFAIATPDAARIASVALVRNGSVTHGVDMNQRYLPLAFRQTPGGLTAAAPANAKVAPPGDYMLFIVDTNGVPSVAPFVRLPGPNEDSQPPTAPGNLSASTAAAGSIRVQWAVATDDRGVVRYDVYRSTTPGFTPSAQTLVGSTGSRSYVDSGLAAGTYYYLVRAADAAGNVGPASNEASAVATADTVAPTVSVTSPPSGAIIGGTIELTADAADNVAVAWVQFYVDGVAFGAPDTSAPYGVTWSSRSVANGPHTVLAVARDASGNERTSEPVTLDVQNAAVPGLVAAWGFDDGAGSAAADATGNGHTGALHNVQWSGSGRYGGALSFNGFDAWVTVADAAGLRLTTGMTLMAWVHPTTINGFETVVLKERPGNLSYALYAHNPDASPAAPAGWVQTHAGADAGASGTGAIPVHAWTHLATTYDGGAVRLYVNGVLARTVDVTGEIVNSDLPLRIGGNEVWGEFFNGLIDEVRVYSRALSVEEIQTDLQTPIFAPAGAPVAATSAVQSEPAHPTPAHPAAFPPGTFAEADPMTPQAVWDEPAPDVLNT